MSEKVDLRAVMNKAQEKVQDTVEVKQPTEQEIGKGIVIETKPEKPLHKQGVNVSALNKDVMANVTNYLEDMDKEIEEVKEEIKVLEEKKQEADKNIELVDEDTDVTSFNEKYKEAIVVIDKTQMGTVINFTDEEREKLEKVKKIKLEEVETVELKTLVRKKVKKGNINKILKKNNTIRTTQIVLPISGFTATVQGCSTYELMALIADNENTAMSYTSKWQLIHSKIESTSIGKMDFNTFLNSVAQLEYDTFVYGILCATYPEEDTFPLKCPKCQKAFDHKYSVRTLLRAEQMSDKLKEALIATVDASFTEETAKACFENAILNKTESIVLPESEYVVELGVQTAYSFINDSISKIETLDKKYSQATVLSSAVSVLLIPDKEEGGYFEIEDTEDIIETIFSLSTTDIAILGTKIGKMVEDMLFEYGLMDVTCSNKKCNHHRNTLPVDIDSILFHKYQQVTNTTIE